MQALALVFIVFCVSCCAISMAHPNINSAFATEPVLTGTPLFTCSQTKNMSMFPSISHFPFQCEIRQDCLLEITLMITINNGEKGYTWGLFALTEEQHSLYLKESSRDIMYMPYSESFYNVHITQTYFAGTISAYVGKNDMSFKTGTLIFLLKEVGESRSTEVDYSDVEWTINVIGRSIPIGRSSSVEMDNSLLIGGIVGGTVGLFVSLSLTVALIVGVMLYLKKKHKSEESSALIYQ